MNSSENCPQESEASRRPSSLEASFEPSIPPVIISHSFYDKILSQSPSDLPAVAGRGAGPPAERSLDGGGARFARRPNHRCYFLAKVAMKAPHMKVKNTA